MKCQRSGVCCVTMDVVIIVDGRAKLKPADTRCPHMDFGGDDGITATCKVHEEPWFKETPCHVYGNSHIDPDFIAKRGKPCPVGALIRSKGGLPVFHPNVLHAVTDPNTLEDLGAYDR